MNKRAIRAAFERAAPHYDQAAQLQQEVARRLDERLEVMKIAPALILDAGCGTGFGVPLLRARYPQARLIGLDLALAMLRQTQARHGQARSWRSWLSRLNPQPSALTLVCGDIERLPLARDSVDLIWSNLTLQWVGDLQATLREVHRILRPGGLFAFSTFGPDTLKELRQAFAGIDGYAHVNRFIDMHDIGDMLVYAGFAHPVMEMEMITLTYADLRSLLRELKAIGADTVLEGRRPGLMGRRTWQRLSDNYERLRRDGRLPATFEIIYGHAWAGRKDRLADGRQVIEFTIQRRRSGRLGGG
ncbi:MAG: malonyl-ACP O-methyltransferase BioC [Thiobacillaceae bacterium]